MAARGPEHQPRVPGRRPRVPPAPRSAPVAARPAWEPTWLSLIYGSAENRSRGSRSISTGGCSGSNKSGKWARLELCARTRGEVVPAAQRHGESGPLASPLARTRVSTNPRSHQRERERERGLGKPGPPPTQRLPSLTSSAQEIETLFANLCPRFPLSPWKPFAGGGGWYILSPPSKHHPLLPTAALESSLPISAPPCRLLQP